jgi:NAD(P)-dependent dehydrogenase (short-subunit alcohol dehydrogenase family)
MGEIQYDYSDSTVVVTGGSSGIGREIALRFGEAGATVINGDVRCEPKDGTATTGELIEEGPGSAAYVNTDVSSYDEIRELAEFARKFGGVDVFVNNAGTMVYKPMREVTPEELAHIMDVNVKGTFFGVQVAVEEMLRAGRPGSIINTASISSTLAQHNQVQYDATKGAVRMITRGAALEFAADGIRVNAVAPGQIATEFTEGWSDEAHELVADDELLKPVPLGRAGTPEDVAGAYLFLASEDARYVTGEMLHVDGGWQVC